MNELLFFTQALCIIAFALIFFRLGSAALTAWVVMQAVVANLFVLKQVILFGFEVTASDAFIIGSLLGLNLLQEFFGQKEAKKATWACFFFLFFFAIVSQIHLLYEPSEHDFAHRSFDVLFSPSPRLFLASILSFLFVQQFDILFFAFLKKKAAGMGFASRAALSLVLSQLLDTVFFSFVGLYGLVASLVDVMIMSFVIKIIAISLQTFTFKWALYHFQKIKT